MGEKGCRTQGPPPRRRQEGRVTGKAALLSPVNVARLCPTPGPPPPKPVQPVGGIGFLPGTIPGNRRRKEVRWAGLGQTFCDTPPPPPPPPPGSGPHPLGPDVQTPGALPAAPGQMLEAKPGFRAAGRLARSWPPRPLCALRKQLRLFQTWFPYV